MKRFSRFFLNMILTLVLAASIVVTPVFKLTSYGMSAGISFSDPNATAGQEFDIRLKVSGQGGNLGSANIILKYDPNYIQFVSGDNAEGGAGTLRVSGQSTAASEWVYTLKFKAVQAGSTSVTIDSSELYDGDSKEITIDHEGSSSITIVAGSGASTNANLKALKISPGVLEPAFSPDITEYKTVVGGSCDKLTVSAQAADANAIFKVLGNEGLQLGENRITIEVTAEDGSSRTYTINTAKQEGEVSYAGGDQIITTTVGGTDYEVIPEWDASIIPESFTIEQVDYNGTPVQAAIQAERGLTLLYLVGPDGSGDFFVYDIVSGEISPYAQINVTEKSITVVPLPSGVEVPESFEETTLELNGKKVIGWISPMDTEQNYCFVYGMNAKGEKNFYRYDMKENTIQRYFSEEVAETVEPEVQDTETAAQYNDLLKDYNLRGYILLGVSIIAALLLIAVIVLLIVSRKGKENEPEEELPSTARTRTGRRTEQSVKEDNYYQDLDVDVKPFVKPEKKMTAEERYLRGVEPEKAEEAAVMEQLADDHERMVRDKIAREVEATARAARRGLDDGFEDVEL